MKHTLKTLTLTIALLVGSVSVSYSKGYNCSVIEARAIENNVEDKNFITMQLKKSFLVKIGNEGIFVTQISNESRNTQYIFTILFNSPLGYYSVNSDALSAALHTFAFDLKGSATMVLQGATFVNVWRLKCKDI